MTTSSHFDQKNQSVNSQTNIVRQINNYSATTPPPVPYQIPKPPADFTGREEDIAQILANFDQGATITGLRGMSGVGKTALALVLAEMLKSRFPDGQIFLKLDGISKNPLSPANALSKVIRAFRGFGECLPEDQDDLQVLYNSVLAGKLVLIFLDNAADEKQVEPLIPPKDCFLLITSRKKFLLPGMPKQFFLDTLKPSDACNFLHKICPRIGNHAEELAELCGHLPLALRAAASLLAVKSDLGPESYLKELRSERNRLKMIGKEGVDLDVEASFNLSFTLLPAETARVFCLLSVFPSDFDAAAEEAICEDKGHEHLSELVRWSLVNFDIYDGRYSLHDLARIFAASRLESTARDAVLQRHAEYYKDVLSLSDQLYLKGGENVLIGLGLFDKEWENIQSGQAWAEKNRVRDSMAAELCNAYPNAGVFVLSLRLHPTDLIRWLKSSLDAARKIGDRRGEGNRLGSLGNAYSGLGETRKAIEYYEQALKISREIGDRGGEGNHLGNLGNAYSGLGETRKAIEYYEQALKISREIGDRRGEGNHLFNMSLSLDKLGQRAKAIESAKAALQIFEEIESPNAKQTRQMLQGWQR